MLLDFSPCSAKKELSKCDISQRLSLALGEAKPIPHIFIFDLIRIFPLPH